MSSEFPYKLNMVCTAGISDTVKNLPLTDYKDQGGKFLFFRNVVRFS